jgi:hypothetical protein
MNPMDRLLERANPVSPPEETVTARQEQTLASIIARPRRRRGSSAYRASAVAVVLAGALSALVITLSGDLGSGQRTEREVPPAVPAAPSRGEVLHVTTRLYGASYGPKGGDRRESWLDERSGRARTQVTAGDQLTAEQLVGSDDHVRAVQGALGNFHGTTMDRIAPGAAESIRDSIREPMRFLVESAKRGFRQDNTTLGDAVVTPGEYRGRAVVVHRVSPSKLDGTPSGYYFKWFTDDGRIIAFERGPVSGDEDVVDEGESLVEAETTDLESHPEAIEWRPVPDSDRRAVTKSPG